MAEKFVPNRMLSYDDDALLNEVRRVVQSHFSDQALSVKEFEKFSRVKVATLRTRFGTWEEILSKAGVDDRGKRVQIRTEIQSILKQSSGAYISFEKYKELSGSYSQKDILKTFNVLSWKELLRTEFNIEKVFREIQVRPKEHKVEVTNSELMEDIKHVWDKLGSRPTYSQFRNETAFSIKVVEKRFGGWLNALETFYKSHPEYRNFESTKGVHVSKQDLIADLNRLVNMHKLQTINQAQYAPLGGKYSVQTYYNQFGSWRNAKEAAGLVVGTKPSSNDKEELFTDMQEVWEKLGRQPYYSEFGYHSKYSPKSLVTMFGSWTKAVHEFAEDRNKENAESIEAIITHEVSDKAADSETMEVGDGIIRVKTPRVPSSRLRFRVLSRDSFTCQSCGASPAKDSTVSLHIDHIVPYSKGAKQFLKTYRSCAKNAI